MSSEKNNENRQASVMSKLEELCDCEGYDANDMMSAEEVLMDSVHPGICMNEGCGYQTDVEPDCRKGYCEECETQTVKSLGVLFELY